MSNNQEIVRNIIDGKIDGKLPLKDDDAVFIGSLVPISKRNANQTSVIQALTDWRNQNAEFFFTQFTATPERTQEWINSTLLGKADQMLFLIYFGNELVGHQGFKNLTDDTVLLDNAMLGVRCPYPKIMVKAGQTLIRWLFDVTGVSTVYGSVFADNAPALMLSRSVGFKVVAKTPLFRTTTNDGTSWSEKQTIEGDESKRYFYKLEITRENLYK